MKSFYDTLESQASDYTKAVLNALRYFEEPFTLQDIHGYSDLSPKAKKNFRERLKKPQGLVRHVASDNNWKLKQEGPLGAQQWTFTKVDV